jgi:hypothetical protein
MLTVLSTEEPGIMLTENAGPEGCGTIEVAIDEPAVSLGPIGRPGVAIEEDPGVVGRAVLLTGVLKGADEAPRGGSTAPGVEQMVVVTGMTVVDVRTTVALGGHSFAFEHNVV